MECVEIYDTTLRDGSQMDGVSFSVEDKIRIAKRLAAFGVDYIEGGWPGAVPKDTEFFARMRDIDLNGVALAAFGATRKANSDVETDPLLKAVLDAQTPVVTIVAKSSAWQVDEILRVSRDENLKMVFESVKFLKEQGKKVILDAEHFFDGYILNPDYTKNVLSEAVRAGVDVIVPCDTNGGMLPHQISQIIADLVDTYKSTMIGMHPHNDGDCGTANALAAVMAGCRHVQGTINGLGERTGNANLIPVIANLSIKLGYQVGKDHTLQDLTSMSALVDETANLSPNARAAYVGKNAFTHKAGLHVDGISKHASAYEHISPETVGNVRRLPISEQSGKATVVQHAATMGLTLDKNSKEVRAVLNAVTEQEAAGYAFEGAEASFELIVRKETGQYQKFFDLIGYRVLVEKRSSDQSPITEATLRVRVGDKEYLTVADGDGPVHALDGALRKALCDAYPQLASITLTDFKVRVVTSGEGTAAKVRAIIESTDHHGHSYNTVGVSTNIIEASWEALVESVEYGLFGLGVV